MDKPTASDPPQPPFANVTNNSLEHVSPPSSPAPEPTTGQTITNKRIRRVHPTRALHSYHDSSENTIPDDDSIFNAMRAESEGSSADSHQQASQNAVSRVEDPEQETPMVVLSPTLQPTLPNSHSQWPPPSLNTVLERPSLGVLRTSSSLPRLRDSPQKSSQVIHPQQSINSIHPVQQTLASQDGQVQSTARDVHTGSRSSGDVDSLNTQSQLHGMERSRSSSSDANFRMAAQSPFPLKPLHKPPERILTPPGIPRFGSQEAQELRLSPSNSHRYQSLFSRLLGRHPDESREQLSSSADDLASPLNSPNRSPTASALGALRSFFAHAASPRVTSPPTPLEETGARGNLPPGVYRANEPSALARAEDGTLVRGKFGSRSSGHGIGARELTNHPFGRRDHLSIINESVREIDRACEEAGQRHAEPHQEASDNRPPYKTSRRQEGRNDVGTDPTPRYTYPTANDRIEHSTIHNPRGIRPIKRPAILDEQNPPAPFRPLSQDDQFSLPLPSIRAISPSGNQFLAVPGSPPVSPTSWRSTVRSPLSTFCMSAPSDYARPHSAAGNPEQHLRYLEDHEIHQARQRVMSARALKQGC